MKSYERGAVDRGSTHSASKPLKLQGPHFRFDVTLLRPIRMTMSPQGSLPEHERCPASHYLGLQAVTPASSPSIVLHSLDTATIPEESHKTFCEACVDF